MGIAGSTAAGPMTVHMAALEVTRVLVLKAIGTNPRLQDRRSYVVLFCVYTTTALTLQLEEECRGTLGSPRISGAIDRWKGACDCI